MSGVCESSTSPGRRETSTGDRSSSQRTHAEQFAEFGDTIVVTERQHGIGKSSGVEIEQTSTPPGPSATAW
jgi:hypothetical protein